MTCRNGLQFDDFGRCESPIEALFQLGLAASSGRGYMAWSDATTEGQLRALASSVVTVGSQITFDDSRADFAFLVQPPAAPLKWLIAECDGAAHHATLDGRARDRQRDTALLARGIPTIRFTGAQLTRDPIVCVAKCLERLGVAARPTDKARLTPQHRELARRWPLESEALQRIAQYLGRGGLPSSNSAQSATRAKSLMAALDRVAKRSTPVDIPALAQARADAAAKLEALTALSPAGDREENAAHLRAQALARAAYKAAEMQYAAAVSTLTMAEIRALGIPHA